MRSFPPLNFGAAAVSKIVKGRVWGKKGETSRALEVYRYHPRDRATARRLSYRPKIVRSDGPRSPHKD
jgi:hypothetical protein